ncbi:MAG: co-chaperone GroES [Clostridiales bacterium]|nr:co-chaperone GroES [Clostridiales bacterium]
MKLKPLFDKVVVKLTEAKEQTVGGIFLPTAAKEKQEIAVVIAVGEGGVIDGKEIKMVVSVGDKVLFSKYAGSTFKLDGEEVTVIKQSDILAIVEE